MPEINKDRNQNPDLDQNSSKSSAGFEPGATESKPKREKMDVPQRPGSAIVIGPEGPYSEETVLPNPPDSDAR